jgi:hypothetical protein
MHSKQHNGRHSNPQAKAKNKQKILTMELYKMGML